jgi:DNA-binding transcriptional ArsR family regulator
MEEVAVADLGKAAVALKPLRVRILAAAREPASAATIAAALGLSRQAVNYHVRALAKAGFLRRAGRVRKRGLVEQRYVVSARAFLVAPDALGALDAPADRVDRFSIAYVLTLAARIQHEAARAWRGARQQGKRVPVLVLDSEIRFASPQQRAACAAALSAAVTRVIAEHSAPTSTTDTREGTTGRRYRLALACYPL